MQLISHIIYITHILKLIKKKNYKIFIYMKMVNKYHRKYKEGIQKLARERHQNLSEKGKVKKAKKDIDKYRVNLSKYCFNIGLSMEVLVKYWLSIG